MPPKGADQSKAAKGEVKIKPLLTLPELALGGADKLQEEDIGQGRADQQPAADAADAGLSLLANGLDGDGEDQEELQSLMSVIQNIMKHQNDKKKKHQQAIVQELQAAIDGEVQAFSESVAKEQKECNQAISSTFTTARKKLNDKYKTIEALNTKYQQDLNAAWGEYNGVYSRLAETERKMTAQLEKVRSSHKRKFAQLQSSLQSKLAAAEQQVAKLAKKKNLGDGMGNILQHLVNAGE